LDVIEAGLRQRFDQLDFSRGGDEALLNLKVL